MDRPRQQQRSRANRDDKFAEASKRMSGDRSGRGNTSGYSQKINRRQPKNRRQGIMREQQLSAVTLNEQQQAQDQVQQQSLPQIQAQDQVLSQDQMSNQVQVRTQNQAYAQIQMQEQKPFRMVGNRKANVGNAFRAMASEGDVRQRVAVVNARQRSPKQNYTSRLLPRYAATPFLPGARSSIAKAQQFSGESIINSFISNSGLLLRFHGRSMSVPCDTTITQKYSAHFTECITSPSSDPFHSKCVPNFDKCTTFPVQNVPYARFALQPNDNPTFPSQTSLYRDFWTDLNKPTALPLQDHSYEQNPNECNTFPSQNVLLKIHPASLMLTTMPSDNTFLGSCLAQSTNGSITFTLNNSLFRYQPPSKSALYSSQDKSHPNEPTIFRSDSLLKHQNSSNDSAVFSLQDSFHLYTTNLNQPIVLSSQTSFYKYTTSSSESITSSSQGSLQRYSVPSNEATSFSSQDSFFRNLLASMNESDKLSGQDSLYSYRTSLNESISVSSQDPLPIYQMYSKDSTTSHKKYTYASLSNESITYPVQNPLFSSKIFSNDPTTFSLQDLPQKHQAPLTESTALPLHDPLQKHQINSNKCAIFPPQSPTCNYQTSLCESISFPSQITFYKYEKHSNESALSNDSPHKMFPFSSYEPFTAAVHCSPYKNQTPSNEFNIFPSQNSTFTNQTSLNESTMFPVREPSQKHQNTSTESTTLSLQNIPYNASSKYPSQELTHKYLTTSKDFTIFPSQNSAYSCQMPLNETVKFSSQEPFRKCSASLNEATTLPSQDLLHGKNLPLLNQSNTLPFQDPIYSCQAPSNEPSTFPHRDPLYKRHPVHLSDSGTAFSRDSLYHKNPGSPIETSTSQSQYSIYNNHSAQLNDSNTFPSQNPLCNTHSEYLSECPTFSSQDSFQKKYPQWSSGFAANSTEAEDNIPKTKETDCQRSSRNPGVPAAPELFFNRNRSQEIFARKVFVGGLPIDVTEEEITSTFSQFGRVLVDWPRRPDSDNKERSKARYMTGYVFLVFEEERSVQLLVNYCHKEDEKYYLFISSPTMRDKPVQVRPWRLSDMEYMIRGDMLLNPRRTIFIGGVPRPTKACELSRVISSLYGTVNYVGIDIDPELKYPKGAARVTFITEQSFVAAISGRFVHIPHADMKKRVEIKPYVMDEQMCDECDGENCSGRYAPYFCGDVACLQYFCEPCWDSFHYGETSDGKKASHKPLVRIGDQTKLLSHPPHHNQTPSMGRVKASTLDFCRHRDTYFSQHCSQFF